MPPALRAFPCHPLFFALAFFVAAFADADISGHAALRAFAIVVLGSLLLTAVLVALLRPLRGGIAAAALILIGRSSSWEQGAVAAVLVVLGIGALLLARRMWPNAEVIRRPTRTLNALGLLLLAVAIVSPALGDRLRADMWEQGNGRGQLRAAPVDPGTRPPDIYVILLDGYPRADTSARLFGFDNAGFLEELGDLGFNVAEGASANYMYTALTLASMHHMAYLSDMPDLRPVPIPFGTSLRSAINENPAWDTLRAHGYAIATAKPPWENEAMHSADVFCGESTNDFEVFLVRRTLFGRAFEAVWPTFQADVHRAGVDESFDCLQMMSAATATPKLVFVHVGSPHLPIIFEANGEAADPALFQETRQALPLTDEAFATAYVAQLEYLNGRVLDAVRPLAERPDRPVVLVMSDHGSESRLDWTDTSRSDLAERFGILFAALTPAQHDLFDCDVTPVEVYPQLLRAYLSEDLSPPSERRYFFSSTVAKLDTTETVDPDVDHDTAAVCS